MSRTVLVSLLLGVITVLGLGVPWEEVKYWDLEDPFRPHDQHRMIEELEETRADFFTRPLDPNTVARFDRLTENEQANLLSLCEQTIEPLEIRSTSNGSDLALYQCDVGAYRAHVRICRYLAWGPFPPNSSYVYGQRMDIVILEKDLPARRGWRVMPDGCVKYYSGL